MRKCRNWQTSKTKDLVGVFSCGFKSHLPHEKSKSYDLLFFCSNTETFFENWVQGLLDIYIIGLIGELYILF